MAKECVNKEKITTGRKIDAMMEKARVAFFAMVRTMQLYETTVILLQDTDKLKTLIADAKRLNDAGGDWDRRNRLKVYEALYLIICRDLKKVVVMLVIVGDNHRPLNCCWSVSKHLLASKCALTISSSFILLSPVYSPYLARS